MQHDSRQDAIADDGRWQDDAGRARRRKLWALVAAQAVVLLPLIYLWIGPASAAAATDPRPNLGAGLVGMALMVLGLPWSVFVCLLDNRYGLFDSGARDLFVIGPAVLNMALTSFGVWWTGRHPVEETEWRVLDADEVEIEDPAESETKP
ncbi:hypothetical protein [Actinoplanes derwentensis]|uniref:Uncharacterized protein n=1 Tax=Actinoplanes derwentensis TaxID=113562 RepID=A0A1H1Q9T9_9ACTN|nr:hypothetical protein [Actinoplanes derwentensis]GID82199.1 hypothetical protein Ade03nite_11230 [Actinoplanes derwentensis]SDS20073.1 hypothetical protein SAMN04489716_0242 [Actinoplanes derwentensis]